MSRQDKLSAPGQGMKFPQYLYSLTRNGSPTWAQQTSRTTHAQLSRNCPQLGLLATLLPLCDGFQDLFPLPIVFCIRLAPLVHPQG